jgi:2-dehydropantoate 2-reductase
VKVCIVGAGAIGGLIGAKLANRGHDVTLIARGAHLAALQTEGLTLIDEGGGKQKIRVNALGHVGEAGEQDLVVLCLKAHQLDSVVSDLPATFGKDTVVLTAQNGIPWWYFMKHGGKYDGHALNSVDPGGIVEKHIPVDRVIGSVVYPAAEIEAPGVIRHIEGNRLSLGELDNGKSSRIQSLSEILRDAGFKSPISSEIRSELWTKLWGNLSFNPISALTHATLSDICRFPLTRSLAFQMMSEAQAVAEQLGVVFKISLEKRIAGAEAVGAHKTSMLQDIEAGRFPEISALVGSVVELGKIVQVATPHIDAVYAITCLLARTLKDSNTFLLPKRLGVP